MKITSYLTGCLLTLVLVSCSELSKIEKSTDIQKKLAYANQLYKDGKYNKAQILYGDIKDAFRGSAQAEDLLYNYAYTYYYMGDFETAAFYFKNFVSVFPNSERATEVDYMQAYCFYKLSPRVQLDQTNTTKAIAAMQTFINMHPTSDKVNDANKIIDECRQKLEDKEFDAANLYFKMGLYKAAGVTFSNLMLDYPDSELGDKYKLLEIKSYYQYALNSIPEKQKERYETVVTQYLNFTDLYPTSKYKPEAEKYYTLAQNYLKTVQNKQDEEISQQ
ncbi:MAG: outer membrane protein assembly factor BamD [Chitinophagaceae bacterium]|jgi:outer membrane protein assembly factor BamD|nr:MAG: outer membrane protein assembly factor BamD [Chitinophagaceae bacterium]